jgi:hypothetical protein
MKWMLVEDASATIEGSEKIFPSFFPLSHEGFLEQLLQRISYSIISLFLSHGMSHERFLEKLLERISYSIISLFFSHGRSLGLARAVVLK